MAKNEGGILNFTMGGKSVDGAMITDEANALADAYATETKLGSPVDKIRLLMRSIASRCIFCLCESQSYHWELIRAKSYDPVIWIEKIADCPRKECPLYAFGPSVFQAVQARMECQDRQSDGLQ